MTKFLILGLIAMGITLWGWSAWTTQPEGTVEAYNIRACPDGDPLRWPNQNATYDRSHGGLPAAWQTEIDEAAAIWNNDGGANFNFQHYTASEHDWDKGEVSRSWRIAETTPDLETSTCLLTDMHTRFNTANFSFDVCDADPGDCNQSGTYDVKAVSLHEFGHWFILDHTQ